MVLHRLLEYAYTRHKGTDTGWIPQDLCHSVRFLEASSIFDVPREGAVLVQIPLSSGTDENGKVGRQGFVTTWKSAAYLWTGCTGDEREALNPRVLKRWCLGQGTTPPSLHLFLCLIYAYVS